MAVKTESAMKCYLTTFKYSQRQTQFLSRILAPDAFIARVLAQFRTIAHLQRAESVAAAAARFVQCIMYIHVFSMFQNAINFAKNNVF